MSGNWRSSESGNWRTSAMGDEEHPGASQKRCLSCGKIIRNTPTRRRPTKSYCSLKCRPKPNKRIIGCITKTERAKEPA